MPNPIAHPAAAIPFTKARMIFSALVIGSIAPDFGYFIPVGKGYFMYTLPGLFLYDVPVGLLLLWGFHTFAKWPLLSLLPVGLQRRLTGSARGFTYRPLKRFGVILLSLLTGSLTHIVWDSFTHDYGWVVEHEPFFRTGVLGMPLYALLQELSTVVGVVFLAYWFLRWLPKATRSEELPAHFSGKVVGVFLGLFALTLAVVEGLILWTRAARGMQSYRSLWMVAGMRDTAVFILLLYLGLYCIAWMATFYKTTRKKPAPKAEAPENP
jgi:hypothetical protein